MDFPVIQKSSPGRTQGAISMRSSLYVPRCKRKNSHQGYLCLASTERVRQSSYRIKIPEHLVPSINSGEHARGTTNETLVLPDSPA